MPLVSLNYVPNTIVSLDIPDSDTAPPGCKRAGHRVTPICTRHSSPRNSSNPPTHDSRRLWQHDGDLSSPIRNSVFFASPSLTRLNKNSAELRVAVSDNDCTVKFYDVNVHGTKCVDSPPKRISDAGTLRLDVPVNHYASSHLATPIRNCGSRPHLTLSSA
jgi:hypothetical protein